MVHDRYAGRIGILHPFHGSPLDPLLGVLQRMQIGGAGMGQALHAHKQPGFVHHSKHDSHPGILLAEEVADAVVIFTEIEGAGW